MTTHTRDEIRAAILNIKAQSKIITVAGVEVEMRQPTVEDIISGDSTDRKTTVVKMMVDYTYVPGTSEKVFSQEDTEVILALPFGADWNALNNAVNELTNLGGIYTTEVGNSAATPDVSPSSVSPTL